MPQTVAQLASQFSLPGLRFEIGAGGLIKAIVETSVSQGEIYAQGAHVTHFQPLGQAAVLWMSQHSLYESLKPIRGGVPICFPWFGPHRTDTSAAAHGTARITCWDFVEAEATADGGVVIGRGARVAAADVTAGAEHDAPR